MWIFLDFRYKINISILIIIFFMKIRLDSSIFFGFIVIDFFF